MSFPLRTTLLGLVAASPLLVTLPAHAYEAGDWLVKFGVTQVNPKSNNGKLANGAFAVDVEDATQPSISVTYMATRNLGIEVLGALPFNHTVTLNGDKSATTKHLPPTVTAQWFFLPDAQVNPYVGVGLNYTTFFNTRETGPISGANLKLEDSWGVAAQVGVDIKITESLYANASVRYMDIDSKAKLNGARIGTVHIDPVVSTLGFGMRF